MQDKPNDSSSSTDDTNSEDSNAAVIQRLQEFGYYLTESVENNLKFCLAVLENRSSKKSNSDVINTVSAIASPIPYVGKSLGSALKEGEVFILKKIDKKNAKKVSSDLVYFFNDNKEAMRQLLIQSSIDLFHSFEEQFMKVTSDKGFRRAIQKLAIDASDRIFTYFLENKQGEDISADNFSKGVIFGTGGGHKVSVKVAEDSEEWKTSSLYKKVGLFFEDTNEFFSNEETNSGKYGYRRAFQWEDVEEIRTNWTRDNNVASLVYVLKKEDFSQLSREIREYIMKKSVVEEAKLDREKKHEELIDDHQTKHEETLKISLEQFKEILDHLEKNYEENHQQNEKLVSIVTQNEKIQEERHKQIDDKLTEIHTDVLETKEEQVLLQTTTASMQTQISEIRTSQMEITQENLEQKTEVLSDLAQKMEEKASGIESKPRREERI